MPETVAIEYIPFHEKPKQRFMDWETATLPETDRDALEWIADIIPAHGLYYLYRRMGMPPSDAMGKVLIQHGRIIMEAEEE